MAKKKPPIKPARNHTLSVGERVSDKDEKRCGIVIDRGEALCTVLWEDGETSSHTESVLLTMPGEAEVEAMLASIRAGWSAKRKREAPVVKNPPAELPEWTDFVPPVLGNLDSIW